MIHDFMFRSGADQTGYRNTLNITPKSYVAVRYSCNYMTCNWCCGIITKLLLDIFLWTTGVFFNNIFSCLIRSVVVSKEFEM